MAEVRHKPNWAGLVHTVYAGFAIVLFAVLRTFGLSDRSWLEGYATTMGEVIYLPVDAPDDWQSDKHWQRIVAHEQAHVYQRRRYGFVGFSIPYALSGRWRARYEYGAIAAEMSWFTRQDRVPPASHYTDFWPQRLASADYLWATDEVSARARLTAIRDRIIDQTLTFEDPTDEAWLWK